MQSKKVSCHVLDNGLTPPSKISATSTAPSTEMASPFTMCEVESSALFLLLAHYMQGGKYGRNSKGGAPLLADAEEVEDTGPEITFPVALGLSFFKAMRLIFPKMALPADQSAKMRLLFARISKYTTRVKGPQAQSGLYTRQEDEGTAPRTAGGGQIPTPLPVNLANLIDNLDVREDHCLRSLMLGYLPPQLQCEPKTTTFVMLVLASLGRCDELMIVLDCHLSACAAQTNADQKELGTYVELGNEVACWVSALCQRKDIVTTNAVRSLLALPKKINGAVGAEEFRKTSLTEAKLYNLVTEACEAAPSHTLLRVLLEFGASASVAEAQEEIDQQNLTAAVVAGLQEPFSHVIMGYAHKQCHPSNKPGSPAWFGFSPNKLQDEQRAKLELLLSKGASPDSVVDGTSSRERSTALHLCSHMNTPLPARILLAVGASLNLQDTSRRTPLDVAIQHGNLGMLGLLLKHGGATTTMWSSNHLMTAVRFDMIYAAKFLLHDVPRFLSSADRNDAGKNEEQQGGGISATTRAKCHHCVPYALMHATSTSSDGMMLRELLTNGACDNVTVEGEGGEVEEVEFGRLWQIRGRDLTTFKVSRSTASRSVTVAEGSIALHLACVVGKSKETRELLLTTSHPSGKEEGGGADKTVVDRQLHSDLARAQCLSVNNEGYMPLHIACLQDSYDCVSVLVSCCGGFHLSINGVTPAPGSVQMLNTDPTYRETLRCQLEAQTMDDIGLTALHILVERDNARAAKAVMDAWPMAVRYLNKLGETPLEYGRRLLREEKHVRRTAGVGAGNLYSMLEAKWAETEGSVGSHDVQKTTRSSSS